MTPEQKEQLRKEMKAFALKGGNVLDNAFDFMVSKIEADRQSFIDSIRGKIEKERDESFDDEGYKTADRILKIVNETSWETGK
jgi:hypothetical protein